MSEGDEKKKLLKVDKIPALKGRFVTKQAEGKFYIERPTEEDAGEYQCTVGSDTRNYKVYGEFKKNFQIVN